MNSLILLPLQLRQIIFSAFVLLTISISLGNCSKYSKKVNSKVDLDRVNSDRNFDIEKENPFRMKKVNLLWTKAKKVIWI